MIIFDTNAVNLLPPEGPRADIIRKLRQSRHHKVAVPWIVLEEMAAHQAKHYPVKHQAVVNTLEKLRDVLPWKLESSLEPLDLDRFLEHWRTVYSEIFEVIETSGEVALRALAREAMALPPAKRAKDHSEGARDVAIWFSILEYLKQNPDEHVYFVTDNSDDFGDGVTYPYPMNEDVRGLEGRLDRLRNFEEVVSQFTTEVSGRDAEAAAQQLLRSLTVRERVAQTAVEVLSSPIGFAGLGAADIAVQWSEWLASPEVDLLGVTDVTGHEIEGDVWYTATAQWMLYGLALDSGGAEAQYIGCVWQMKVLFSATDGDETPTLLATTEPSPPDTGDESCMTTLQSLKKRVAGIAAGAKRHLLATETPVERTLSAQLSLSLPTLDLATQQLAQLAANGPAQRLARQVAANQTALDALINSPGHRLAKQLASQQEALRALLNAPGQRLARQIAESMPKLDIATATPQTTADESPMQEEVEQSLSESQDTSQGEAEEQDTE